MKISRFLTLVVLITGISLFYVHQQIELIKFSYKIQSHQHRLDDLLDQNRILKYNVIALKTPFSLENRLRQSDIEMILPERWQVVRVAGPRMEKASSQERPLTPLYSFLRFFAFGREAQAKPAN